MELFAFLIPAVFLINWGLTRHEKKISHQKEIDLFLQKKKEVEIQAQSEKKEMRLIDKITSFLTNNNLKYWISADGKLIKVGFTLENEEVVDLFINVNEDYLEFNSPVLTDIPDDSVSAASEITTRLNQFYRLGHLKLFYETRDLIFHNILIFYNTPLIESDFMMYLNHTVDSCKHCRLVVSKVVIDKEEPFIAVMSMMN